MKSKISVFFLIGTYTGGEQELRWHPGVADARGGDQGHDRHGQSGNHCRGFGGFRHPLNCCGYPCLLQV